MVTSRQRPGLCMYLCSRLQSVQKKVWFKVILRNLLLQCAIPNCNQQLLKRLAIQNLSQMFDYLVLSRDTNHYVKYLVTMCMKCCFLFVAVFVWFLLSLLYFLLFFYCKMDDKQIAALVLQGLLLNTRVITTMTYEIIVFLVI